jgi:hypothetical protein
MTEPSHRIEAVFKETKRICAGRFVMDIPSTAHIVFGRADIPLQAFRYPGDAKNINRFLGKESASLDAQRHLIYGQLKNNPMDLGKVLDGAVNGQKNFVGLSPISGEYYELKAFVPVGDDLFILYGNDLADPNNYAADINELNETAHRLTPMIDYPTERGFCIDNAFVRDGKKDQRVERVQIGIRLAEFPDVHFSVEMVKKDIKVESDALEPRIKEAEEAARIAGMGIWRSKIKYIRRGNRALNTWNGYEALARVPPHGKDKEKHQFMFVALGEPKNPYLPTLDAALDTGVKDNHRGAVAPSITDDEALYVWDRLLGSLKIRPIRSEKP